MRGWGFTVDSTDSPHPRGWTRSVAEGRPPDDGFPAPAGMDLGRPTRRVPRSGIPRTRGDGPVSASSDLPSMRDSPHPRGWTRVGRRARLRRAGFPAPAGMDRRRPAAAPRRGWIPRTRGDGPVRAEAVRRGRRDSPHPRGWTLAASAEPVNWIGFPAPAGMDPRAMKPGISSERIPRTRGDGPETDTHSAAYIQDSPHPRGWTGDGRRAAGRARGFPAPAGMDPSETGPATPISGIPRTRGDGPLPRPRETRKPPDSPHPRGWTPEARRGRSGAPGFPAPAGMDPSWARCTTAGRWIPRTRGDGPARQEIARPAPRDSPHPRGWTVADRAQARRRVGFPAPAGMDPHPQSSAGAGRGIPRTRGDGPALSSCTASSRSDSPHPRGWTRAISALQDVGAGFPAPAGMDPCARLSARALHGIPRTRGDGPRSRRARSRAAWDSPHPRGWTGREEADAGAVHGFPAPAGMDPRRRCPRGIPAWIPRTRGDGPTRAASAKWFGGDSPHPRGWTLVGHRDGRLEGGFLAPAGMDPRRARPPSCSPGIPRTRGDGPWTPSRRYPRARRGFPAPAGMDPRQSRRQSRSSGIPRTRGDGPGWDGDRAAPTLDSPHPRGWTPGAISPGARDRGFPAPAGMDPDRRPRR